MFRAFPPARQPASGRRERRRDDHAADRERAAKELLGGANAFAHEEPLSLARLATLKITGGGQQLRGHAGGVRGCSS